MTSHSAPQFPGLRSRLVMAVLPRRPQARRQAPTRPQAPWWSRGVAVMLAVASVILGGLVAAAQAQLNPGDILVVENPPALSRVDPQTGQRTLLSDFTDASQGPTGLLPLGVAVEKLGTVLVIDQLGFFPGGRGRLFRVDPQTGQRTFLNDFNDASQGPLGVSPRGVAVEEHGTILVIDRDAGLGGEGQLLRIDPQTGQRTFLNDFGADPEDVAVEAVGTILVSDEDAGTNGDALLFRIDPQTGMWTPSATLATPPKAPRRVLPIESRSRRRARFWSSSVAVIQYIMV